MNEARQFRSWLVCQFCGRTTPVEDSEGWLNQPHRERWDIRVVRCPQHWSEWALRHTREGRTRANREAMAEALAMPVPQMPPHVSPFPTTDREEDPAWHPSEGSVGRRVRGRRSTTSQPPSAQQ